MSSTSYKHTPNIWRKEDEKSFTATNNKQTPIRHYKRGGLFADRTWFTFSRSDFKINWLKYWILDKMRQLCFYGLNTERKWATKRKRRLAFKIVSRLYGFLLSSFPLSRFIDDSFWPVKSFRFLLPRCACLNLFLSQRNYFAVIKHRNGCITDRWFVIFRH